METAPAAPSSPSPSPSPAPLGGGGGSESREEELENLIKNYSIVFMGLFMEEFSELAEVMTKVQSAGAEEPSPGGLTKRGDFSLEVQTEIRDLFSEIRKDIASQWPKNQRVFKQYISRPDFDKGIEIVDRYDFHRPRLTEKLSDEVLLSYVFLLRSGDRELESMFKELADWRKALPKPPWET